MLQSATVRHFATGARADLVFYDSKSLDLNPPNDLLQQLVCAERGRSITRVMVDGITRWCDGVAVDLPVSAASELLANYRKMVGGY